MSPVEPESEVPEVNSTDPEAPSDEEPEPSVTLPVSRRLLPETTLTSPLVENALLPLER